MEQIVNPYNNPYYLSPAEFISVLQESMQSASDYNEPMHPEDVGIELQSVAEHVTKALSVLSDKFYESIKDKDKQ
jgi:hypothetical protein